MNDELFAVLKQILYCVETAIRDNATLSPGYIQEKIRSIIPTHRRKDLIEVFPRTEASDELEGWTFPLNQRYSLHESEQPTRSNANEERSMGCPTHRTTWNLWFLSYAVDGAVCEC